ncbi:MAG: SRPBCC family protein [Pirellulales bacterium]|nr:SRPBCC family protein [Pirellulales bacterium]
MKDRIQIAARPDQVWPYVADPELMAGWNPKIVGVDREARGLLTIGERFWITYRMTRQSERFRVTVVELAVPSRLVLRHEGDPARPDRFVLEEYRLDEVQGGTTRVKQQLHLRNAGLPLWLRPLLWLLHTFGRPTDKRYLEELRDLVESEINGRKSGKQAIGVARLCSAE